MFGVVEDLKIFNDDVGLSERLAVDRVPTSERSLNKKGKNKGEEERKKKIVVSVIPRIRIAFTTSVGLRLSLN